MYKDGNYENTKKKHKQSNNDPTSPAKSRDDARMMEFL